MYVTAEATLQRASRRQAQQLKVEADTLAIKWSALQEKALRWYKIIEEALNVGTTSLACFDYNTSISHNMIETRVINM